MKQYNISNSYKEKIYHIVLKLPKKTDLQKEKFIRYYGLKQTDFKEKLYLLLLEHKSVHQML